MVAALRSHFIGKTKISGNFGSLSGLAAVFSACLLSALPAYAVEIASPDGRIVVDVDTQNGIPGYSVTFNGKPVLDFSRLGLQFQKAPDFVEGFDIASVKTKTTDLVWTQPWGEEKDIRDHHKEARIVFQSQTGPDRQMTVTFRVFDDGVGFRYDIPAQAGVDAIKITDELTEFTFHDNLKAWWIPAYKDNRYEYQYAASSIDSLDVIHTPATFEGDKIAISIHEAALTDYASMTLRRPMMHGQTLKADLVPWADGIKVYANASFKTPWRTIQIADTAYELANSRMILNLNEPNALGDVSWVKPGKYVGIWWCAHIRTCTWETGEKHGATTENTMRYMDFAAKYGFDGVLVEGWNIGWDGNWYENGDLFRFTEPTPDFDIEKIAAHGRKVGVPLIGHHETSANIVNYENQLDAAFAFSEKHGMRAVKTGYVGSRLNDTEWHHGQYMVRHFQNVVETAARHHIAIDAHEPIKDTGLRRTYPNMMTREGARGGEYDAWSHAAQGNHPDHATILPYTRMLSGPMDYTAGIVDLRFGEQEEKGVSSTVAKQLALMVVIYSPLQMAADLPENYEGHPGFQFIRDVPADWEDSIALDGRIGDYFVMARKDRNSPDWYLGAVSDEQARTITVPLDFLDNATTYRAEIYADGEGAHWLDNPQPIAVKTKTVTAEDSLSLELAQGGGQAIRFTPLAAR
ncbi:alpha-glucosidase [Iodidimonas muriae]|uniref:Alpha-glucosidase n=1 Tax=Iodidimonas muriae TaxID=261467 RepID=A0ABQ2L772_9PROT|nr:glycoside hydrolase family 97 protein [Iodidimonas muriae]GER06644.1 alpha-glucosidase [Kordiimonadales bacterium JCM 17843]GGO05619.1 alpha-glucosidase [Iodidimonas muriae]